MAIRCKDCRYYRCLSESAGGRKVCHYIISEGKPRNCDIDNCDKFKRKEKKRRMVNGDETLP